MSKNTIKNFSEFLNHAITLIDECVYQSGYITCDIDGTCNYRDNPTYTQLRGGVFGANKCTYMLDWDTRSNGAFSASIKYLKEIKQTREKNTMNMSNLKHGQVVELRSGVKMSIDNFNFRQPIVCNTCGFKGFQFWFYDGQSFMEAGYTKHDCPAEKYEIVGKLQQDIGINESRTSKLIHVGDRVRIHNYKSEFKHGEPDYDYKVFTVIYNKGTFAFTNELIYMPAYGYDLSTGEMYDIEILPREER